MPQGKRDTSPSRLPLSYRAQLGAYWKEWNMADDFMVKVSNDLNMVNPRLTKITLDIIANIRDMQNHGLNVALLLARVKNGELWKDTFSSYQEYTETCFGLKKAQAYKLAAVGSSFLTDADTGYAHSVISTGADDYNTTQLIELLPLKSTGTAKKLHDEGRINPHMSTREIKAVVDEVKPTREKDEGDGDGEGEVETAHIEVKPENVLTLKHTITIEETADGIAVLFIDGEQATKKAVVELIGSYRYR
jgi:hypothetical protein